MRFLSLRNFRINFGPQHPSAHGVLRLILELNGEMVVCADPHIGLLHRGTEKLIEHKTYFQGLPYCDRLDYVSMMVQEQVYSALIELFSRCNLSRRSSGLRTIWNELTRLLNHLMSVTTHALDVGALSPFLWGFEEREKLMELYERTSGARMHAAYIRPGGLTMDSPLRLFRDIRKFCKQFFSRLRELKELLTSNRIGKQRLLRIGILARNKIQNFSLTGVMARASGMCGDLRHASPYEFYQNMLFKIPIGLFGDSYDRYLLRIHEMQISTQLVLDTIFKTPYGAILANNKKIRAPRRMELKKGMEEIIAHFKYYSSGPYFKRRHYYTQVEAPKGETGVFLWAKGNRAIRCKFRAPGFFHLQALHEMVRGFFLADVVTVIGTQDIVFGEIDR